MKKSLLIYAKLHFKGGLNGVAAYFMQERDTYLCILIHIRGRNINNARALIVAIESLDSKNRDNPKEKHIAAKQHDTNKRDYVTGAAQWRSEHIQQLAQSFLNKLGV